MEQLFVGRNNSVTFDNGAERHQLPISADRYLLAKPTQPTKAVGCARPGIHIRRYAKRPFKVSSSAAPVDNPL
ncbi:MULTISPECIES: hypothetical protein [Paraburkholderia]|uniref:hypothetical protein n=1 Tax=Paraburkholderia TaxID=1822464 RepID=UPI00036E2183|nr:MULTISPECIES: hypothetical protein [Paraburkholderia]MDH6147386.1 hypothetical protein [Paraburkholderia sp. WSM4179]